MTRVGMIALTVVVLSSVMATSHRGFAASAQCNLELRKCTSHCNLVYESKRANRTCRNRCVDSLYACRARPS